MLHEIGFIEQVYDNQNVTVVVPVFGRVWELFSFHPDVNPDHPVHHFKERRIIFVQLVPPGREPGKAHLSIIQTACHLMNLHPDLNDVYLPMLGCGRGKLNPRDVYPILKNTLDDRFTLIGNDPDKFPALDGKGCLDCGFKVKDWSHSHRICDICKKKKVGSPKKQPRVQTRKPIGYS